MRILIVEDEAKIVRALKTALEAEGYEALVASTGEEGFFIATSQQTDLILLDLGLPGRDGIEILSALRKKGDSTPVLILTARDTIDDRVIGLDSGADDYLVKPFAVAEVLARIRALLRRGRLDKAVVRLSAGSLEMDLVGRKVTRDSNQLALTPKEYELLEYLLRHKGEVVSREMLARDVWKESSREATLDNVIDVSIARLRKKVDDENAEKLIKTIRGVGFKLSEDPS